MSRNGAYSKILQPNFSEMVIGDNGTTVTIAELDLDKRNITMKSTLQ